MDLCPKGVENHNKQGRSGKNCCTRHFKSEGNVCSTERRADILSGLPLCGWMNGARMKWNPSQIKLGKTRIHRITGKPVDYAPVVYRLAWMKKHEPGLFHKIRKICDVHTYLAWRLTGHFRTSWASADPLGLFDMRRRKWSPQIMRALELEENQLPEVYCPGSAIGKITKRASEAHGIVP